MKTFTRSPDGGCVTETVTRQTPFVSSAAESIVVFGSETLARSSHEHTGVMPGKNGLGGASAARRKVIAAKSATVRRVPLIRERLKTLVFMAEFFVSRRPTSWQRANVANAEHVRLIVAVRRLQRLSLGP